MKIPTTEPHPDDLENLPPARRRRARRLLAPLDANERADFLEEIRQRTTPSFDFFSFSLLAGLVLTIGLLIDAPSLLVLGAIMSPFMAPVVGVSLGTIIGSGRFFLRSMVGLVTGAALVLGISYLVSLLVHSLLPDTFYGPMVMAHLHAQLSWIDFVVLALGAVTTVVLIVNPDRNPVLPGVALAYELYLPLAAAGIGLGGQVPHLWPDGLVVFTLHLAWAALLGALTLAYLGFRPLTLFGYTLGGAVMLWGVIMLIAISSAGVVVTSQLGLPTPVPSPTPTFTLTPTASLTPVPPTATLTPTATATATSTPTITPSPTSTPVYAAIQAAIGDGAILRAEPAGKVVGTVMNGARVQVLPDVIEKDGLVWYFIVAPNGNRGWINQNLLATLTPLPATAQP